MRRSHTILILCVLVIAVAIITHAGMLAGPFSEIDDLDTIAEHPAVLQNSVASFLSHSTSPHMGLYVPVTQSLWHVLSWTARLDEPDPIGLFFSPLPFRIASLTVFALSGVALLVLASRLGLSMLGATIAALVFVVHPVQVESVAWISGFKDLLAAFFVLAALLAWSHQAESTKPGNLWYWAAITLSVVAMLSKPMAICVAPMVLVMSRYVQGKTWTTTLVNASPILFAAAAISVVTKIVQTTERVSTVSISKRPFVALDTLGFYLNKLCWPVHYSFDYGRSPVSLFRDSSAFPSDLLIPLIGLLLAIAMLLLAWKIPATRFAIALIFFPLLPVLGLVTFQYQAFSTAADHYLLLPMAGVGLLIGQLVTRWKYSAAVVALPLVLWTGVSRDLSQYWADSPRLYATMLQTNPRSSLAMNNLASHYLRRGRQNEAIPLARAVLESRPHDVVALTNLGTALLNLEQYDQAIIYFDRLMPLAPRAVNSSLSRAATLWNLDRRDEALAEVARLQKIEPTNVRVIEQVRILSIWKNQQSAPTPATPK